MRSLPQRQHPKPHPNPPWLTPALLFAAAGGMFLGLRSLPQPTGNSAVPQPAKPVDLQSYLGRWYELARYENRFERGCEGVTADYGLRPDGLIDVVNACQGGWPHGRRRISRGRARIVAGSGNARLKVSFVGPFFVGNYWILDHADDYQWAIVGEPSGRFLWILCRDHTPPTETYNFLVSRARDLGYDTTLLRRTRQPPA